MSIKYATFLVKPGEVIPKEVATVILKEFSTGMGYAIAVDGVMEVVKGLGQIDPDNLMEMQEANKDTTKLFWFCKSDNPVLEEDLQPFVLVEDHIVACLTGDFSEYAQTGSSHTNEYHAAEKLKPKAVKLWKANESSMEKFMEAVADDNDDTFETMTDNWVPDNSAIAYLLSSGKSIGSAKPDEREQEHPWGWSYGAPQSEDKPKGRLFFKKTEAETPKAEEKKPDPDFLPQKWQDIQGKTLKYKVEGKEQEFPVVLALAQDGVSAIAVSGTDPVIPIPPDKDTKDKIVAWYKEKLGYCPHNWKKRPYIKAKGPADTVKLGDLQNTTAAAALQTAAAHKDTTTRFIPPPKIPSKEIVKHFLEQDWPKILGQNSEFIQNPKYIEDEAKEPSLAALMNDKRFVDISSFDMPRFGRHLLIDHIRGPSPEYWVAFLDNWMKDNIQARHNLSKQISDQANTIKNLETELEKFRSNLPKAEDKAAPATKGKLRFK